MAVKMEGQVGAKHSVIIGVSGSHFLLDLEVFFLTDSNNVLGIKSISCFILKG